MSPSVGPPDTAGEVTELIAAHQLHFGATTTTSEAIVATLMTEKGTATLQIRAAESEQLSAAAMYENPDPHVRSQTRVWVHPDHLGRGIGTALTVWGIANAQSEVPSAPRGQGSSTSVVRAMAETELRGSSRTTDINSDACSLR